MLRVAHRPVGSERLHSVGVLCPMYLLFNDTHAYTLGIAVQQYITNNYGKDQEN